MILSSKLLYYYSIVISLCIIMQTVKSFKAGKLSINEKELVETLIKKWAPLVWLAPDEKFMPLGVDDFLHHVHAEHDQHHQGKFALNRGGGGGGVGSFSINSNNIFEYKIPMGDKSEKAYLVTNMDIDKLLENSSSFLYGRNPIRYPVPVYAVVRICNISNGQNDMEYKYDFDLRRPYIPIPFDDATSKSLTDISSHGPSSIIAKKDTDTQNLIFLQSAMNYNNNNNNNYKKKSNFISNNIQADNNDINTGGESGGGGGGEEGDFQMMIAPSFHVTYWMFYPFSQGKTMCSLNLGPFGRLPIPMVFGKCFGSRKEFGNHIGDWEHMSLFFSGSLEPDSMYVSAHDAGAYYNYNRLTHSFEFKSQETRKGILQKPNFPKTVVTSANHPVLFAAQGSHGLWAAPGKHRFVRVARLYDINGFGTPWHTWKEIEITYENLRSQRLLTPKWLHFKGKWGNPKSKCHPLRRIGLNFCEYTDGPTGIPLKIPPFQCNR